MEPPDEAHLRDAVSRAQQGDRAAFEELVHCFQRPVRAWLSMHCPPGGDVDEVAQLTFLSAFTRLAEFQEGTNFAAWLFTIARFQLMTETTRLRRLADYHTRYAPSVLLRELERRAEESDDLTATRLQHLHHCLEKVGEQGQQFIKWRYEEGLPLQEMAVKSGRSLPAVKKQLWLLRQRLQQCIESKLVAEQGRLA